MSDEVKSTRRGPFRPLLLAVLLLAALGSIAIGVWLLMTDHPVEDVGTAIQRTVAPKPPPPTPAPVVLQILPLPGTDITALLVGPGDEERGTGSYFSEPEGASVRNLLLLDTATGESRQLLPDDDRRIVQHRFLPAAAEPKRRPKAADTGSTEPAAYYALVTAGADDDAPVDLIVGRLDDARQATVLTGLDRVLSVWNRDETTLAALVRQDDRLSYRLIDMETLTVTSSTEVPIRP